MLDKIKLDLRIKHSQIDQDIQENIDACLLDLKRVGIIPLTDQSTDALVIKSVKLYCRWQYNFENQADRYKTAYENLRNALSLCYDYKDGDPVV